MKETYEFAVDHFISFDEILFQTLNVRALPPEKISETLDKLSQLSIDKEHGLDEIDKMELDFRIHMIRLIIDPRLAFPEKGTEYYNLAMNLYRQSSRKVEILENLYVAKPNSYEAFNTLKYGADNRPINPEWIRLERYEHLTKLRKELTAENLTPPPFKTLNITKHLDMLKSLHTLNKVQEYSISPKQSLLTRLINRLKRGKHQQKETDENTIPMEILKSDADKKKAFRAALIDYKKARIEAALGHKNFDHEKLTADQKKKLSRHYKNIFRMGMNAQKKIETVDKLIAKLDNPKKELNPDYKKALLQSKSNLAKIVNEHREIFNKLLNENTNQEK